MQVWPCRRHLDNVLHGGQEATNRRDPACSHEQELVMMLRQRVSGSGDIFILGSALGLATLLWRRRGCHAQLLQQLPG